MQRDCAQARERRDGPEQRVRVRRGVVRLAPRHVAQQRDDPLIFRMGIADEGDAGDRDAPRPQRFGQHREIGPMRPLQEEKGLNLRINHGKTLRPRS